jgi:hypothetical protein
MIALICSIGRQDLTPAHRATEFYNPARQAKIRCWVDNNAGRLPNTNPGDILLVDLGSNSVAVGLRHRYKGLRIKMLISSPADTYLCSTVPLTGPDFTFGESRLCDLDASL